LRTYFTGFDPLIKYASEQYVKRIIINCLNQNVILALASNVLQFSLSCQIVLTASRKIGSSEWSENSIHFLFFGVCFNWYRYSYVSLHYVVDFLLAVWTSPFVDMLMQTRKHLAICRLVEWPSIIVCFVPKIIATREL